LVDDILNDPNSAQQALRLSNPIRDCALHLAVGRCAPDSAVSVFRPPEDEEIPDDEEELKELGDVGNFTGVYICNLDRGTLIERIPYSGQARSGGADCGSPRLVALEVRDGIDLISRGAGEVREIRALAATLDVNSMWAAWLAEDGHVEIRSIIELL